MSLNAAEFRPAKAESMLAVCRIRRQPMPTLNAASAAFFVCSVRRTGRFAHSRCPEDSIPPKHCCLGAQQPSEESEPLRRAKEALKRLLP